jgi:hypothetical protein
MHAVDVDHLDADRILGIDYGSEDVGQNRHTYPVDWGKRPPYVGSVGPSAATAADAAESRPQLRRGF